MQVQAQLATQCCAAERPHHAPTDHTPHSMDHPKDLRPRWLSSRSAKKSVLLVILVMLVDVRSSHKFKEVRSQSITIRKTPTRRDASAVRGSYDRAQSECPLWAEPVSPQAP